MSIGGKSQRTRALELRRLGWSLDEIARAVGVDRAQAQEFIYGKRQAPQKRFGGVSPASAAQRDKVRGAKCIVCGRGGCDPAHVIPRSLGGGDEPEAVVPLCREHHREYDENENLSLLEYLEPRYREELAYAVKRVGLLQALTIITGQRWTPQ